MTREEIVDRLKELLGEENAAAAADALAEAEAPGEPEAPAEAEEAPGEPEAPAEAEEAAAETEAPAEAEEAPAEPEVSAESEAPVEPEAPAEPDPAEALRSENASLRERLLGMALRLSALSLGVAPERADAVRRLANLEGIDLNGEQAAQQVEAAVRRVLEEVPELAGGAALTTGSVGSHPRALSRPADPFLKGFFN